MADLKNIGSIEELLEGNTDKYNNPLSNQFLAELWYNYLPYLISRGTTELEAERMFNAVLEQLYPNAPTSAEEVAAYYKESTGRTLVTERQRDEALALIKDDKQFQPKDVFSVSIGGSNFYRQFDDWREKSLTVEQKQNSEVAEAKALQVADSAYGGQLDGLKKYLTQQVYEGKLEPQDAEAKLMMYDYESAIGEQAALNQSYAKTVKPRLENTAKAEQALAQEADYARQRQSIQDKLELNLLPYPSSEEYSGQFEEGISDMTNPAMQQFIRGKQGDIWDRFMASGGKSAIDAWWKTLNAPALLEAEAEMSMIGGQVIPGGANLYPLMSGENAPFGTNVQTAISEYGLPGFATAEGAASEAARRFYESGQPYMGSTELTDLYKRAVGASTSSEEPGQEYGNRLYAARLSSESAKKSNPWQRYISSKGSDWYREFWSTPRSLRPGGYRQVSIAPSVKQRYAV